mgnify:CR=1 FL=1
MKTENKLKTFLFFCNIILILLIVLFDNIFIEFSLLIALVTVIMLTYENIDFKEEE